MHVQVQFSPDGRWLVSASFDKAIKLWDGVKGTFRGHLQRPRGASLPGCLVGRLTPSRVRLQGQHSEGARLSIPAAALFCFLGTPAAELRL